MLLTILVLLPSLAATIVKIPANSYQCMALYEVLKHRRCFYEIADVLGWQPEGGRSAWPSVQDDPSPNAPLVSHDAMNAFVGALSDPRSDFSVILTVSKWKRDERQCKCSR